MALSELPASNRSSPESRPADLDRSIEPSFGSLVELVLVAVCSLVALLAYVIVYWPWRTGSSGSPLEFFAALPVLCGTAVAALSLGSSRVVEFWRRRLDERPWEAWFYPGGIWVLYTLGTLIGGHGEPRNILILGAYLVVPVAFALVGKLWSDWLMVVAAAVPILAQWLYLPNLPVPGAHNQVQIHPLIAACIGFWAILVVRRFEGFQFRLVFTREDFKLGVKLFAAFGLVMFPVAILAGFGDLGRAFTVHRGWNAPSWAVYVLLPVGMYFYPALVEEALYRGLLQNLLAKSLRSEWVALVVAALVFGSTHFNGHATVQGRIWFAEYALFAAVAGGCYGYAYLKTKRIMPGAVAHALINTVWLILFNPELRHLFPHHHS